ncbi:hypothetical protein BT69DRAFT_1280793 [Atractiella rhizophila]|nr:hypothetical protein BT69DRAFT_1280793 [Atractiella rhizophila]
MSRFFNPRLTARLVAPARAPAQVLRPSTSFCPIPLATRTVRWSSTTPNSTQSSRENAAADEKTATAGSEEPLVDPIEAKLEEKEKEIARLKDSLLRSLADFENLQKITKREALTAKDFAIQSFAKELVSSIDVLALALSSVEAVETTFIFHKPQLALR